jgi:hypothetical protein
MERLQPSTANLGKRTTPPPIGQEVSITPLPLAAPVLPFGCLVSTPPLDHFSRADGLEVYRMPNRPITPIRDLEEPETAQLSQEPDRQGADHEQNAADQFSSR